MDKEKNNELILLDIGCGPNKKVGYVGVDILKVSGVDVVVDLDKENLPYADNSIDGIYSSHFFEHISDPVKTIKECVRVLKVGGRMHIIVPHYSNPYAYHFTHKTFWSSYSLGQEYINYYLGEGIELISKTIKIVNFWPLDVISNAIANKFTAFYERFLNSFIKAWEIEFVLEKTKNISSESPKGEFNLS